MMKEERLTRKYIGKVKSVHVEPDNTSVDGNISCPAAFSRWAMLTWICSVGGREGPRLSFSTIVSDIRSVHKT